MRHGGRRPGAGRPAGSINNFTAEIKKGFEVAFLGLQESTEKPFGHLLAWATEHPTEFYKICARWISPQTLTEMPMDENIESLSKAQLEEIILMDEGVRKLLNVDCFNRPLGDETE